MDNKIRKHIVFYGRVQGEEPKIDELILFLEKRQYVHIENFDVRSVPLETEYDFYEK